MTVQGNGTNGIIKSDNDITINAGGADNSGGQFEVTGDARIVTTTANDTVDIQSDIAGVDVAGVGTSVESLLIDVHTGTNTGGTIKIAGNIAAASGDTDGNFKTVTLKGKDAVYLGGTITTAHDLTGNNIDIDGPVILTAATTLDTSVNDGTIDFSSTTVSYTHLTLPTKA